MIVVVGGGLAGLSCALHLRRAGREVQVLEADRRVGGRIGSVRTPEGFVIDRGFQVLFSHYPSVRALLDVPRLQLRAFDTGAIVRTAEGFYPLADPTRHLEGLFGLFGVPFLTPIDAWHLTRLSLDVMSTPVDQLLGGPPLPATEVYLRELGFSPALIESFMRPFFGGVFLSRALEADARVFRFYWRMLAIAPATLPETGMQAIPDQLAELVGHERIRLGARVEALVREADRVTGVRLEGGETIAAEHVVLAAPYPEIRRLAGLERELAANGVTNAYFATRESLTDEKKIILNAAPAPLINQVAQVSNVSPAYAPPGWHLIAVQMLGLPPEGDEALAGRIRDELSRWFPAKQVAAWRLLEVVRTPFGQFREEPETMAARPQPAVSPGLWLASEVLQQSSIEGALSGGRRTARMLLEA